MISGRRRAATSLCRRCPPRRGHVCVTARLLPNVRCKFPLSRPTQSAPTFRRIPRRDREKDIYVYNEREEEEDREEEREKGTVGTLS